MQQQNFPLNFGHSCEIQRRLGSGFETLIFGAGRTCQPQPVLSRREWGADFGGKFGEIAGPGGIHFLQFSPTHTLLYVMPTLDMNLEISEANKYKHIHCSAF